MLKIRKNKIHHITDINPALVHLHLTTVSFKYRKPK